MKSIPSYILYFTMVSLIKKCTPECTHYYMMLQETYENTDDIVQTSMKPIAMSQIIKYYPDFNSTAVYNTLQEYSNCILEFSSLCNPETHCEKASVDTSSGTDASETTYLDSTNVNSGNSSSLVKDWKVEKTAAIAVVGTAVTAGLMYFIVQKIIHMRQYGAYFIP